MFRSSNYDCFGHIRAELPDLKTELVDLFQLPKKEKKKIRKKNALSFQPVKTENDGNKTKTTGVKSGKKQKDLKKK